MRWVFNEKKKANLFCETEKEYKFTISASVQSEIFWKVLKRFPFFWPNTDGFGSSTEATAYFSWANALIGWPQINIAALPLAHLLTHSASSLHSAAKTLGPVKANLQK